MGRLSTLFICACLGVMALDAALDIRLMLEGQEQGTRQDAADTGKAASDET